MPINIKNYKLALIGLIILFAISSLMAGGGKPKFDKVSSTIRPLSTSEILVIIQQFPDLVPDLFKDKIFNKRDTCLLKDLFPFKEIEGVDLLKHVLPTVHFYSGENFERRPRINYLMAVSGNKRYYMPNAFNQLLLDNGLGVTDKNIIELAKAFVIIALEGKEITFLEGKRIKEERMIGKKKNITYTAQLRVKVGDEIRNWYLPQDINEKNQFGGVTVTDKDGKVIKIYQLLIIESNQKRGGLDLNPGIEIETGTANSNAYVDPFPHYYLFVDSNGQATNYKVKFNLTGFEASAPNVYIGVRDSNLHQNIALMHIEIDNGGSGDTIWVPGTGSTGIYWVTAGHADDTNPEITYQPATSSKELTLEKTITEDFQTINGDFLTIYYTTQFFHNENPPSESANAFANYVKEAALTAWDVIINDWNFDYPEDDDKKHQFFINDNQHWYHGLPGTGAEKGAHRKIYTQFNILQLARDYIQNDSAYGGNKQAAINSQIGHDFFHGIQWRYSPGKYILKEWDWFTESQARFIESVYPNEELKSYQFYSHSANIFLRGGWVFENWQPNFLNTSLSWSGDHYYYCLYWRFLYEKFYPQGSTAQKLSIIRDCYRLTDSVGTKPIADGARAIDKAFVAAGQQGNAPFGSFAKSIDSFATACYLKNFNKLLFENIISFKSLLTTILKNDIV